jgi:hypothetical protein
MRHELLDYERAAIRPSLDTIKQEASGGPATVNARPTISLPSCAHALPFACFAWISATIVISFCMSPSFAAFPFPALRTSSPC